jgi:hypothetical protein
MYIAVYVDDLLIPDTRCLLQTVECLSKLADPRHAVCSVMRLFNTFASVVKPMSYKALFAIAAALDLEIEQMDVKTAFLYGEVDHEIYVEQPHHTTER